MRSLLLLLIPAAAQAAPKLCAPSGEAPATLTAKGDDLVLCFADACQNVADGAKAMAPVKITRKLGKKAAAAVAKAVENNNGDASIVQYSAEGLWVTYQQHLWDVLKDKEVKVQQRTPDGANLATIGFANDAPIGLFYACAGPCGVGYPLNASFKVVGKGFPGGDGVMLDDKRALIVPEQAEGKVSIVDMKSGKVLGTVPLGDGMSAVIRSASVKLVSGDVGVFYDTGDKAEVLRISAPAGKPPTVVKSTAIPACP